MFNRGFTLIEILVVIVVIALLVSITAINSDRDPYNETLKSQATNIKFYLEVASDEAVLNNKNIGLYFNKHEIRPYTWQAVIPSQQQGVSTPSTTQNKYTWEPYLSRQIGDFILDEDLEMRLFVADREVQLPLSDKGKKAITPQLYLQASGIQTISKVELSIPSYEGVYTVVGNGAGRFNIRGGNDDEF